MNMLIVDDQISVVNSLVNGIDWNKLGISKVYKAFSAFEAKALFNNITIDLLLTDIEMPGENGINLVQWIRKQGFETESIFLTAHADFEYARDAIKVESFEYILQPCPFNEIEAIVCRAIDKIRAKKEQQKLYTYGKMAIDNNPMKKLMFYDCLKLDNNSVPLKFLISIGILPDMKVQGYLTMFEITEYGIPIDQWDRNLLEFTLHNVILDIFEPAGQKVLMSMMDSPFVYAFFCYHPDSYVMPAPLYERQIEILKDVFHDMLKLTICFYKGSLTNADLLHEQYQMLDKLRNNRSLGQDNQVNSPSIMDIENSEIPESSPVTVITQYIREHLGNDITRSELADLVHLNIDYLSRIFKKETCYTLNDYITIEKMKMAQKLIQTTVLPIGLIASKVGYSNFSYFSKLYKKIIGSSPMEDRVQRNM